jgi:hypothetical protein
LLYFSLFAYNKSKKAHPLSVAHLFFQRKLNFFHFFYSQTRPFMLYWIRRRSSPSVGTDSRLLITACRRKDRIMTKTYEDLPKIAKLLLQFFFGWLIGGVYRIVRYTETKNIVTLVVGLLVLFTGIGNGIAWVLDWITELLSNRITVLAD